MDTDQQVEKQQVDAGSFFNNVFQPFQNNNTSLGTQLPCKRGDLYYNMRHGKRGRCVILNYRIFNSPDLNERKGTDKDANEIMETFKALNFTVEIHHNKTYVETMKIFNEESKIDHSNFDCFVMFILSHGSNGTIHSKDKPFDTSRIFEHFTGSRCQTLIGKPKLFFIQACQGNLFDSGTWVHDSPVASSSYFLVPNYADFLIFYSTFPGHYSWRNVSEGSWFIQSLCSVLKRYFDKYELMTVLTLVCQEVAFNFQSRVPNSDMDKKKQIPCIMSTLTRLVQL